MLNVIILGVVGGECYGAIIFGESFNFFSSVGFISMDSILLRHQGILYYTWGLYYKTFYGSYCCRLVVS
jgi:hypothetical protein